MVVSILPHTHPRWAHLAARVPTTALALALAAPALDLVGLLQRAPLLAPVATAACGAAALVLAAYVARQPGAALAAAVVALLASMALRLSGMAEGPALSLLAIVALGAGGYFSAAGAPGGLLDELPLPPTPAPEREPSDALRPAA